jgi:hypothetical protein
MSRFNLQIKIKLLNLNNYFIKTLNYPYNLWSKKRIFNYNAKVTFKIKETLKSIHKIIKIFAFYFKTFKLK